MDADAGKREPAFDHAKLAESLAKVASRDVNPTKVPFDFIAVDGDVVRFVAFDKGWAFDRKTGMWPKDRSQRPPRRPSPAASAEKGPIQSGLRINRSAPNPWTVTVKDSNLFLKKGRTRVSAHQRRHGRRLLRADRAILVAGLEAGWSPCAPARATSARSPWSSRRRATSSSRSSSHDHLPQARRRDRRRASRTCSTSRSASEIPVNDELFANPWSIIARALGRRTRRGSRSSTTSAGTRCCGWSASTRRPARRGRSSTRESKTFIDYAHKQFCTQCRTTGEMIWMSERDGWNHLYLYDAQDRQGEEPDHQGRVGRPRRRSRGRARSGRSGSGPAASTRSRTRTTSTTAASTSTAPAWSS